RPLFRARARTRRGHRGGDECTNSRLPCPRQADPRGMTRLRPRRASIASRNLRGLVALAKVITLGGGAKSGRPQGSPLRYCPVGETVGVAPCGGSWFCGTSLLNK